MFDFNKEIMGDPAVVDKDAKGKLVIESPEKLIEQIRKECQSKSDGAQFVVTEPKPHPSDPERLVTILDVGSAVVLHIQNSRKTTFESFLAAIEKMKAKLSVAEEELRLMLESPLMPGLNAINEQIEEQLKEPDPKE